MKITKKTKTVTETTVTVIGVYLELTVEEARLVYATLGACVPSKRDECFWDRFPTIHPLPMYNANKVIDPIWLALGKVLGARSDRETLNLSDQSDAY